MEYGVAPPKLVRPGSGEPPGGGGSVGASTVTYPLLSTNNQTFYTCACHIDIVNNNNNNHANC